MYRVCKTKNGSGEISEQHIAFNYDEAARILDKLSNEKNTAFMEKVEAVEIIRNGVDVPDEDLGSDDVLEWKKAKDQKHMMRKPRRKSAMIRRAAAEFARTGDKDALEMIGGEEIAGLMGLRGRKRHAKHKPDHPRPDFGDPSKRESKEAFKSRLEAREKARQERIKNGKPDKTDKTDKTDKADKRKR